MSCEFSSRYACNIYLPVVGIFTRSRYVFSTTLMKFFHLVADGVATSQLANCRGYVDETSLDN